jgi:glycosyltransferase involved in cell wall biosynthesis
MNDPNKGGCHPIEAMNVLQTRTSQALWAVISGAGASRRPLGFAFLACVVGTVRDDRAMAALLAAADATVVPSEFDNLPKVVLESLACGMPVVAFRVGGIPQLVEHGSNGWLAKPFDVQEPVTGMGWVHGRRYAAELVSESVALQFEIDVVTRRYRDFYVETRHCTTPARSHQ